MINEYEEYVRSEKTESEKEPFVTKIDGIEYIDVIHNFVFRRVCNTIEVLLSLSYQEPHSAPKKYADIREKVSVGDVGSLLKVNNEALYRCANRGLFEEADIFAKIIHDVPEFLDLTSESGSMIYTDKTKKRVRTHTYASILLSGKVKNKEQEKHVDIRFFPVLSLPKPIYHNTFLIVQSLMPQLYYHYRTH